MKFMSTLVLAFSLFSLGCSTVSPSLNTQDTWFEGEWSGVAFQPSGNKKFWRIVVSANQGTYTVTYPSLNCGGVWKLNTANESLAQFTEEIKWGKRCILTGTVFITKLPNGQMSFSYMSDSRISSTATLSKILKEYKETI